MAAKTESLLLERPDAQPEVTAGDQVCRPKHVLFLVDRFPSTIGGGERILLRTTRLLTERGYRCSVITFEGDPQFRNIRPPFNCPFYVFPLRRTYDANAIRIAAKLIRFIRSENIEIVHTFFSTSDLWGGLIAKLAGCPVLISSRRDMGIERSLKHDVAYRLLGGMFDQVQAVSHQVRLRTVTMDRLPETKVVTLHNGVDLEQIRRTPMLSRSDERVDLKEASHVIVSVGNVRRIKGVDVLLKIAAEVCQKFPTAVFAIIGGIEHDREYYKFLKQQIHAFNLGKNVKFLGYREDAIPVLKSCDVYCQCSRSEGLPNSLLEAMACGLPCVATAVGGTPEVISNGNDGFLVSPDDSKAGAQRILDLLDDPSLARRIGIAAEKTIAERFTSTIMADQLVNHYENIFASKKIRLRGDHDRN